MADLTVTATQVAPYFAEDCRIRSRQLSVAFTAGRAGYYNSSAKAALAAAATAGAEQFMGVALDAGAAGETVRFLEDGWLYGFDLSGLAYMAPVYLSDTAGNLTGDNATGNRAEVGYVDFRNDGGTFTKVLRIGRRAGIATPRTRKVAVKALTGAGVHGGVQAWQNPEGAAIIITRVILDVTTQSAGAGTVSIGTTATSATTSSANLLDTQSVAAVATLDNITDKGTNGKTRQKLASGKWVTIAEASGDVTGFAGNLIIEYILA